MKKMIMFIMAAAISMLSAADISVYDDGSGTGTTTWTSDNVYYLENHVFVNPGDTLTIEPGTVIKGRYGVSTESTALIVCRGAYGIFEGTQYEPIIFTSEYDDFSASLESRGLWGGVIVLGSAGLNSTETESQIEGIPETEPRGMYGGGSDSDDTDDSGIYRYLSIRYGGVEIGAANEINGFTMGALGSGTTVDHIEVAYNLDDGFEWFGGTVNCSYLIAAFCGDDCFDYDVGYRGKGQFWFALQDASNGDKCGEHDGGTDPEDGTPYAIPSIYNVTYIGCGTGSANSSNSVFNIRDNAGGHYKNGIFADFPLTGIAIEDLASGADSRQMLENGDLTFTNCMWYGFGGGNNYTNICASKTYEYVLFTETARKNLIVDPQLEGISRTYDGGLDPRAMSSTATTEYYNVTPDGFFVTANYIGAFNPSAALWTDGWTYLDQFGYTADVQVVEAPSNVVTSMSDDNIVLSWDVVPGAVSYSVYSADEPYGTYTLVTTVTGTSYTEWALNTKKFYYVKANN